MAYTTLLSVAELAYALGHREVEQILLIDCSFDLSDPMAGRRVYECGHIPGAIYVHLEDALSAPKTGRNGRHPLPRREAVVQFIATLGAEDDCQIISYDGSGGMYAARLWWMLRWVGHHAAAVLDGGLAAWVAAGGALSIEAPTVPRTGGFSLRPSLTKTVDYARIRDSLDTGSLLVIDARAPDRFRGDNETLDPVGGHIPGARNRLFRDNLSTDGRFKPAAQLRSEFNAIRGLRAPSELVSQCGSGVTACHNLLALEIAGLPGAALYPGSWSEWCTQPGAPIGRSAVDGECP